MTWTDPDTMDGALTGDALPLAWWNAAMGNFDFLATAPLVAVRLTAAQQVAHDSDHTIDWNTAVWSAPGSTMWDPVASSKIVIPRAGVYSLTAHALYDQVIPVDDTSIWCYKTESGGSPGILVGPVKGAQLAIESTNLALDDELEFVVKHQFGAAVNLVDTQTAVRIRWVGMPPTGSPA